MQCSPKRALKMALFPQRQMVFISCSECATSIKRWLAGREQQICPTRHTKARHNLIVALGIYGRLHQHDALVPLLVIVGDLQHGGALAAVHGAVTEKEFAHVVTSANRAVAVKYRLQSG
jgi:hypothetical protein